MGSFSALVGTAVAAFVAIGARPASPPASFPAAPSRAAAVSPVPSADPSPSYGRYAWPVRGPVLRSFEPPESTFGPGHRGIDIGAAFGTRVVASASGLVAFAGPVAGSLFVSIDHPDGVRTTYSWLSEISVRAGSAVGRGEAIGSTGSGHPGSASPHLHFGARIGSTYIDPMLLLERGSIVGLVHLAPLDEAPPEQEGAAP